MYALVILVILGAALLLFWDNLNAFRKMRDQANLNYAIYFTDKNQDPEYLHHKTSADLIMVNAKRRLYYAGAAIVGGVLLATVAGQLLS